MTPDDLADAGYALYGERWQTALARDLRISDRTMRRWLVGDCAIPGRVENNVRTVLTIRLNALGGMIRHGFGANVPSGRDLHGFLRESVVIPAGIDLTAPLTEEDFAAEEGKLYR